jgi:hypothetical protein
LVKVAAGTAVLSYCGLPLNAAARKIRSYRAKRA